MSRLYKLAIGHAKLQQGRTGGTLTTNRVAQCGGSPLPASINDYCADRAAGRGIIAELACTDAQPGKFSERRLIPSVRSLFACARPADTRERYLGL
jgi:hypothetical protein